jgi:excisionase family DNA binding protein
MSTPATATDPGWVTLTAACHLLGVSPSTIRRWADTGMVRTFVTPGGHRRFSRSALEALLPERPKGRPSMLDLGETPGRMARGYRRAAEETPSRIPWIAELDDERRERFRHYGRGIVVALVAALDADDDGARHDLLRDAEDSCTEYGRVAGREGLGSVTTADLFLRFRRPFLAELGALARRREFDAAATATLMADANAALDGLLLATLRGWEAAAMGAGRRPRRAAPSSPGSPS